MRKDRGICGGLLWTDTPYQLTDIVCKLFVERGAIPSALVLLREGYTDVFHDASVKDSRKTGVLNAFPE